MWLTIITIVTSTNLSNYSQKDTPQHNQKRKKKQQKKKRKRKVLVSHRERNIANTIHTVNKI